MKISRCTFVSVIFIYLILLGYIFNINKNNSDLQSALITSNNIVGIPYWLSIPKLKINSEIILGQYDFNIKKWNVSMHYPQYAIYSTIPNVHSGTTVLYAHNSTKLFGKLNTLKSNDTVSVFTRDGKQYIYKYAYEKIVVPTDVSVFYKKGKPQLVLLTCSGFNNNKRNLQYFSLVKTL